MTDDTAAVFRVLHQRVVHEMVDLMTVGAQLNRDRIFAVIGEVPQVMPVRRRMMTGRAWRHPFDRFGPPPLVLLAVLVQAIKVRPVLDHLPPLVGVGMGGQHRPKRHGDLVGLPRRIDAVDQPIQPRQRRGFIEKARRIDHIPSKVTD